LIVYLIVGIFLERDDFRQFFLPFLFPIFYFSSVLVFLIS
jgi:hypothetical protein